MELVEQWSIIRIPTHPHPRIKIMLILNAANLTILWFHANNVENRTCKKILNQKALHDAQASKVKSLWCETLLLLADLDVIGWVPTLVGR